MVTTADGQEEDTRTFTRDSDTPDSALYNLTGNDNGSTEGIEIHTLSKRHQLRLSRSFAKRSGDYRGSDKARVKSTVDVEVANVAGDGLVVAPSIAEVSFSLPRGINTVELHAQCRELAYFMLSTEAAALIESLSI
jgi:hypothetical protein